METVCYSVDERGIGRLVLNRPGQRNALSRQSFEELNALLDQAAQDTAVRVLVLTGAGKAFCAGGDLQEMQAGYGANAGFYQFMLRVNQFTAKLADLPKPVIAAVNGPAFGAGMNVALAADLVVASRQASFAEVFGNVGLVPDVGGAYLLPRIVGRAKAKELILTHRTVSAQEALELGIVHRLVEPEALEAAVQALAEQIAKGPTFAYALGKQILNRSSELDLQSALSMESMAQALAANSEDHKEGVAAFFEKRRPEFRGK